MTTCQDRSRLHWNYQWHDRSYGLYGLSDLRLHFTLDSVHQVICEDQDHVLRVIDSGNTVWSSSTHLSAGVKLPFVGFLDAYYVTPDHRRLVRQATVSQSTDNTVDVAFLVVNIARDNTISHTIITLPKAKGSFRYLPQAGHTLSGYGYLGFSQDNNFAAFVSDYATVWNLDDASEPTFSFPLPEPRTQNVAVFAAYYNLIVFNRKSASEGHTDSDFLLVSSGGCTAVETMPKTQGLVWPNYPGGLDVSQTSQPEGYITMDKLGYCVYDGISHIWIPPSQRLSEPIGHDPPVITPHPLAGVSKTRVLLGGTRNRPLDLQGAGYWNRPLVLFDLPGTLRARE
ncbi:hypothetical protein C8J56DRAFT_880134 [Mycena floridula]|nr:hypothetical protein C8J56DRAFT_880134 [Mycena floridula]